MSNGKLLANDKCYNFRL